MPSHSIPSGYARWWLDFRNLTDETALVAETLKARISGLIPKSSRQPWGISDIGCGDGRTAVALLQSLLKAGVSPPTEVVLVDPLPWVHDAVQRCQRFLTSTNANARVTAHQTDLRTYLRTARATETPKISLLIHSAYYVDPRDIDLLSAERSKLGTVILVDALASVFGDAWQKLNPIMHRQFHRLHAWLNHRALLLQEDTASVRLPDSQEHTSVNDNILSFLALREYRALSMTERQALLSIVTRHCSTPHPESVTFKLQMFSIPALVTTSNVRNEADAEVLVDSLV